MNNKYEKIATASEVPTSGVRVDTSKGEMMWEWKHGWVKDGVILNEAPPEFWYREIVEPAPVVEETRFPSNAVFGLIEKRISDLTAEKKETLEEYTKAKDDVLDMLAERNTRISMELKFIQSLTKEFPMKTGNKFSEKELLSITAKYIGDMKLKDNSFDSMAWIKENAKSITRTDWVKIVKQDCPIIVSEDGKEYKVWKWIINGEGDHQVWTTNEEGQKHWTIGDGCEWKKI